MVYWLILIFPKLRQRKVGHCTTIFARRDLGIHSHLALCRKDEPMKKRRIRGFSSIKDGSGLHKGKRVTGNMNLGKLMRQNSELEDYLYSVVTNTDWVFDDMDFSIEEFSDISGVDLEELLEEINQRVKLR